MVARVLQYTERDGAITFTVRVTVRASESRVVGEHDGALRVRVAAPPIEGAANRELIRTLARALDVPSRAVIIKSGHASKVKQVRVEGVEPSTLQSLSGGARSAAGQGR